MPGLDAHQAKFLLHGTECHVCGRIGIVTHIGFLLKDIDISAGNANAPTDGQTSSLVSDQSAGAIVLSPGLRFDFLPVIGSAVFRLSGHRI